MSCDSVAVYRQFEIGTAKPTRAERELVPHHLIDVADPGEAFTAGEYSRQARAAIADISGRGKLPIVVGETGFISALCWKVSSLGPTARRSYATACATGRHSVDHHVFIAYSHGLIPHPPRRFTPTTHQS